MIFAGEEFFMDNLVGEFVGTIVLVTFGCGSVANVNLEKSKAKGAGWTALALAWGLAVMLGASTSIALGAPQADLNPAITFIKVFLGIYTFPQFIVTSLVQIAGGIVGGIFVWLLFLPHWELTEDKSIKLAVFSTGPAVRKSSTNFLCEMIATGFLMFCIWMLTAQTSILPQNFVPFFVGLLIVALTFSFGEPTGLALNPARDLGPRIAHAILPIAGKGSSDWGYSWIPVVAPFFGTVLAFVAMKLLGLF